ncbi:MAG: aminoglycoside phosphotransferase family protein [Acetatifactor sp.]|nr:aminoglycoside phosphotransferase family protein [Acetatifactor sp.]
MNGELEDWDDFIVSENFMKRVIENELNDQLDKYCDGVKKLIRNYLPFDDYKYCMIEGGHRCTFLISGNKKYILTICGGEESADTRNIIRIKDKLQINKAIVIYEDSNYCLMHFANRIENWEYGDYLKQAVLYLKRIHNCNESIIRTTVNDYRYLELKFRAQIERLNITFIDQSIFSWIDEEIIPIIDKYGNKLCHGDASYGNVLEYNGKVEFVDWELLKMGNPLFDIFYFYESLSSIYVNDTSILLKNILSIYYPAGINIENIENIVSMRIYFMFWRTINFAKSEIKNSEAISSLLNLKKLWEAGDYISVIKDVVEVI